MSRLRALPIDRFEWVVLAGLCGVALTTLAALATKGRPLSGADGLLASDQLQYLTWIREVSEHVLIGNRFDLAPGERAFLHPGMLVSGLVHALTGISIALSYLLWKPVAIAVVFTGALLYVRRLLDGRWERRVALVIALFAVMPAAAIVDWSGWGGDGRLFTFAFISGEVWTGMYLWGYLMTAMAVFSIPLVLLAVERWRSAPAERRRARTLAAAAAGGLLVCWLQPWQGATLAAIVVGTEALRWWRAGERPAPALAAVPLAVALPALYYLILSHADPAWELAGEANARGAMPTWRWPWWAIVATLAPLGVPAALAYRLPAPRWQDVAVRIWPFAALAVYLAPLGTFPYHAFQGIQLPLAILAVTGVASLRWRPHPALVAGAVALLIVPGFAHKVDIFRIGVQAGGDPYFVFPGEVRALDALESDPRPGGVLGPTYAGYMIPYRTGRETYVGPFSWTPDWDRRRRLADDLFEGRLTGAPARAFVRSTRARFLFADCRRLAEGSVHASLRPLVRSVRRFDCATVWELRFRPEMARAAGPPDA